MLSLVILSFLLGWAVAEPLHDNSPTCNCYFTISDTAGPQYFSYYRFYDFRYLPGGFSNDTAPDLVSRTGGNEVTTDQAVLNGTDFTNDWGMMSWGTPATSDSPVEMWNSPQNIFLKTTNSTDLNSTDLAANTFLTLRTTREPNFQSSAEIENEQKNMLHATLRFHARIVGDAGAVAGLFTYADESDEADVEVLTRLNASTIYYSTQPSVDKHGNDIAQGSVAVGGLPDYSLWHEHRIDWLPGVTRWFIDGALARTSKYSTPRKPSGLVMNMWSNGGVWSGNMSVGGGAELHVQWVEVAFNTSGSRAGVGSPRGGPGLARRDLVKRKQSGCKTVCAIDAVATPGHPEIKYTAGTSSEGIRQGSVVLLFGALWLSLIFSAL